MTGTREYSGEGGGAAGIPILERPRTGIGYQRSDSCRCAVIACGDGRRAIGISIVVGRCEVKLEKDGTCLRDGYHITVISYFHDSAHAEGL